jgi:hypothetical protein
VWWYVTRPFGAYTACVVVVVVDGVVTDDGVVVIAVVDGIGMLYC